MANNSELIKELRTLTAAGMKDCKDALMEANWDLKRAVDIVKTKGLNIVSGRAGKVASEGKIKITSPSTVKVNGQTLSNTSKLLVMVEVNAQTDFTSNSKEFNEFLTITAATFCRQVFEGASDFDRSGLENLRNNLIATTKENIIIRRWWAEETSSSLTKVFSYTHSNNKLGVLLSLMAPSVEAINDPLFEELGNNLAMQVAAMSPLAVSPDHLEGEDVDRQKAIFETQLKELNKPQASWEKIMLGKMNKWHTEVCLLNQESIMHPKTTVAQTIKNIGDKLGGEIQVLNFIRCQVGEGIEQTKANLAEEVSKLM